MDIYNIGLQQYITVHTLMNFEKEQEQIQTRNKKITIKITPYPWGKIYSSIDSEKMYIEKFEKYIQEITYKSTYPMISRKIDNIP